MSIAHLMEGNSTSTLVHICDLVHGMLLLLKYKWITSQLGNIAELVGKVVANGLSLKALLPSIALKPFIMRNDKRM